MTNELRIETRHGTVTIGLSKNPWCCGVVDYGAPVWPTVMHEKTKRSRVRLEVYEDVLMTLRHCFADGSRLQRGWDRYVRGIGTLSDAENGERGCGKPNDPPCIHDMMTLVAPKLAKEGKLIFSRSDKAVNPNSGRYIFTWQLVRDYNKYDREGKYFMEART